MELQDTSLINSTHFVKGSWYLKFMTSDLKNQSVLNFHPVVAVFTPGILYINPADLGWSPPVFSWIETREVQSEKTNLTLLFDKYIPPCLEAVRSR